MSLLKNSGSHKASPERPSTFGLKARQSLLDGSFENKNHNVDARPIWQKFVDYFPLILPYIYIVGGISIILFPVASYWIFISLVFFMLYAVNHQINFLCDVPVDVKSNDFSPRTGDSFMFLGYSLLFGSQLWMNLDRETRMSFISGTTGSGKTVCMNAFYLQAAIQGHLFGGAPIIICDGKGSVKGLYEWLWIGVRTGRLHDLRIMNFLTSGEKQSPHMMLDEMFTSNRFNPYSVLNPEECRGLVMSFGRSSEGGNSEFFRDRASTMLAGIFRPLCYKRDILGEPLDVTVIRYYLDLRAMFRLASSDELPKVELRALREYLKSLNCVDDSMFNSSIDWATQEINSKADEQHTYNCSMLSKTLNEMAESLGHIFCSSGSEFSYKNTMINGHISIVLLPTIEREPDAMAELGRMQIGSLRPAFAPLLGHKFQGAYKEVIGGIPNNRLVPIRLFFDEILNYYVKGISNFLSLLRSSHVAFYLMGQSLKGIEDAGLSEARQSLANLNNKFMFSNQDVFETFEWLRKTVGQSVVKRFSDLQTNFFGQVEIGDKLQDVTTDLINERDLGSANSGEGLYVYRGDVQPFRSPYIKIPELKEFYLNMFSPLLNPTDLEVKRVKREAGFRDAVLSGDVADIDQTKNTALDRFTSVLYENYLDLNDATHQYQASDLLKVVEYAIVHELALDNQDEFDDKQQKLERTAEYKKEVKRNEVKQRNSKIVIDGTEEPTITIVDVESKESKEAQSKSSSTINAVAEPMDASPEAQYERQNTLLGIKPKDIFASPHTSCTPEISASEEEQSFDIKSDDKDNVDSLLVSPDEQAEILKIISGESSAPIKPSEIFKATSVSPPLVASKKHKEDEANESDGDSAFNIDIRGDLLDEFIRDFSDCTGYSVEQASEVVSFVSDNDEYPSNPVLIKADESVHAQRALTTQQIMQDMGL